MEVRSAVIWMGKVNSGSNFLVGFLIYVSAGDCFFLADPAVRIRKSLSA